MTNKGKIQSSQDNALLDTFQSHLNASSAFWQETISALSAYQIENLQHPTPLRVRNNQPKVANFFERVRDSFYRQSVLNRARKDNPTLPKVMVIAPGVFVIDATQAPDLTNEDCAPPDTMSGSDKYFPKNGGL